MADAHHHEGIATVLLEDLAGWPRGRGSAARRPDVARQRRMQAVFRTVGLVHRSWFDDGVVNVQLDLTADHILQDDADLRDWRAAVRSFRTIVASGARGRLGVGAGRLGTGRRILAHLVESFGGRTASSTARWAMSTVSARSRDSTSSMPFQTWRSSPCPATTVTGFARGMWRCGGADRRDRVRRARRPRSPTRRSSQDEMLAAARRHGMRIIGPDSLGVVSHEPDSTPRSPSRRSVPAGSPSPRSPAGSAWPSPSRPSDRCAGISSFVSMGNKVDVSGNDLLRLWADDDPTTVVLLYLESFGDPVRFARVARAVSQRKPVVALKGGRSVLGRRTRRSLAAALADDQATSTPCSPTPE